MSQQPPQPPDSTIVAAKDRLVIRRLRRDGVSHFHTLCGDPVAVRSMGDGQPLTPEQTRPRIGISLENDDSKRVLAKAGMVWEKRETEEDGVVVEDYAVER